MSAAKPMTASEAKERQREFERAVEFDKRADELVRERRAQLHAQVVMIFYIKNVVKDYILGPFGSIIESFREADEYMNATKK